MAEAGEAKLTAAPKWGKTVFQLVEDEPHVRPGDGANRLPSAEPLSKGNLNSSHGKAMGDLSWIAIGNTGIMRYNSSSSG